MHSRIFGIIEEDYYNDLVKQGDEPHISYDDEVPHFADYTDNNTDLDKDFDWLLEGLINKSDSALIEVNHDEHTIKFKTGYKEKYFRSKWDALIKNIIGDPDAFDQFCGNKNSDFAYKLKKIINEEFGFYAADEYGGYETLDDFIRHVDYDLTYKVFQSIDYHW